jgi:hypothetical protein
MMMLSTSESIIEKEGNGSTRRALLYKNPTCRELQNQAAALIA